MNLEPQPPSVAEPGAIKLDAGNFLNRELSWLAFDERVVEEAEDRATALLDRVRFLAISASNLDEFFEVRVAGLQGQFYAGLEPQDILPDGMPPQAQLAEIARRCHEFVARQYALWRDDLRPALAEHGIRVCVPADLTDEENRFLDAYFERQVSPVLTPLAIDPAHPFPHLFNKTLNIILRIEPLTPDAGRQPYAVLRVPSVLSRLVPLPETPEGDRRFVLLEDVIGPRLDALFGGFRVVAWAPFRVTRNSDLTIQETEVKNSLLSTIQETLRQRKWGAAVRLEILETADEGILALLMNAPALDLEPRDVYRVAGPVDLTVLQVLTRLEGARALREPIAEPVRPAAMAAHASIFAAIREGDFLVHHPYESFAPVVQFVEEAADDPNVLAIKQTLYRTAGDNPIIGALARAAENGKEVTALVEIQARLDEENNIDKARLLQRAGVHVVYGIVGLKTHCKATLVVRREHDGIRRYLHLSTGNYNPTTAQVYTDLSLFTCKPEFGEDASALFNLLTGYSQGHDWKKLIIAPYHLVDRIDALIHRERDHARAGLPARIIAKMNSLVDPQAIASLYEASRAGVRIDLIVRGICCLRPGVPGLSENIRVVSIVDKFLEHVRVFAFQNNDAPEVYLSSADWMPRNFRRRVEILFPVEEPRLRQRILDSILGLALRDNVKARVLRPDGTYERIAPAEGEPAVRSQVELQALTREPPPDDRLRAAGAPAASALAAPVRAPKFVLP
jgi:polyphosphate kinase